MPDCQQVLPGDGVSAWTRDLSRDQREAQEHEDTQTLYLQLTEPDIIPSAFVLQPGFPAKTSQQQNPIMEHIKAEFTPW